MFSNEIRFPASISLECSSEILHIIDLLIPVQALQIYTDGPTGFRDMAKTESEKSTNARVAVCFSRSLTKTLELD